MSVRFNIMITCIFLLFSFQRDSVKYFVINFVKFFVKKSFEILDWNVCSCGTFGFSISFSCSSFEYNCLYVPLFMKEKGLWRYLFFFLQPPVERSYLIFCNVVICCSHFSAQSKSMKLYLLVFSKPGRLFQ
jgi:hypothetical protein